MLSRSRVMFPQNLTTSSYTFSDYASATASNLMLYLGQCGLVG
jgi:hypothetical protein